MKKFLSLLLTAILLLSCIPAMAEAGTFTANADKYMITAYKGSDENLVVPASVDGAPTPIIHDRALNGAKKAVTLSFEEGVTQIRSMNIASMDITKLTLPSTLEVIASNNIYQTDKLTEVTVPAAVSYVGTLSFSYCDVLTKVTFTGLCPVFGPRPFVSTAKDLVVYVPDDQLDAYKAALPEGLNVQPSGKKAVDARVRVAESDFEFDAATGTIKKYTGTASYIEIPATIGGVQVKTIGQKAFYQHSFMTVVIIPEGVETLEMYSIFAGKGLYCVEFPSTLKTIGKNALWASELDSLTLPEGLETIGESAFASAINKIDELVIPDSVTSIGKEAFYSCMPVKVVIGANVQSLPEASFSTLHNVTEIVIRNKNGMTIDPKAFQSSKKGTTITLMDGITEEVYNSYVEQLAVAYESATVNQPELAVPFPKLDAEAGAPFIGTWNAVAVFDGTDYYGMDLLGISMIVNLQADGTGVVDMDGDAVPGGWYVDNGTVVFAPILEEGGQPVPEEAMPFTMDENGRMVLDLGGLYLLLELEGKTYAVPAIPEKPWPELDAAKAQYYVGTWDAVSYIVEGETYDAALMGPMTLTLNADGTAQMIEGEEEAYELRWYAESYSAYVGPAMSALAEISFDGNGNIKMEQDGAAIIMAPHVEAKVIEGADELLGDWYDDIGNKLTLVNDGTLTHTYSYDGWTDEYAWDVVDGAAVVTEGPWSGLPITLENGILIITNDEGIFQLFSVDGDLSAYYGDDEGYELPEAQPIGPEGEAYFGAWKADMYGMEVIMTLNQDGTCTMDMMGEVEPGVWAVVDGKANVMGDELYIDGDGNLVYEGAGMVFTKTEGGASSEEMSDEEMLLALMALMGQMEGMEGGEEEPVPANDTIFGRWEDTAKYLDVYEDGRIEMTYKSDGYVTHMAWEMVNGVPTGSDGLWKGIPIVIENGSLVVSQDTYYQEFTYVGEAPNAGNTQTVEEEVEEVKPETTAPATGSDPYIGTKFVLTGASINGINLTAEQLNAAGDYVIFNADGSVELCMSDRMVQTLGWTRGKVNVVGAEHDGFCVDYYGTYYNFGITGDGLILDYFGTPRFYEPEGGKKVEEPAAPEAPAGNASAGDTAPAVTFSSYEDYMDIKFVAKTYTSFGNTMDASMLGAEYAVTFHANGSCEFIMAGVNTPGLTWGLQEISMGLTKQEAFVINYYGMMYNCIPTATGFDMDFYGTMNLHFVPAE